MQEKKDYELVRLVDHDPAWAVKFAHEAKRLSEALAIPLARIQHIGSTTIPGIKAKAIIDIIIGFDTPPNVELMQTKLGPLGYTFVKDDPVSNRCLFVSEDPVTGKGLVNLHLAVKGEHYHDDKIAFRDYLLDHPESAKQYEALKLELAEEYPEDRFAYAQAKAHFVNDILAREH